MEKKLLRILIIISALLLLLLCAGCSKSDDEVVPAADSIPEEKEEPEAIVLSEFPEKSFLFGINMSGLDEQKAKSVLQNVVRRYNLAITIDGTVTRVSADELGLRLAEVDFPKIMAMFAQDADARNKIEKELVLFDEDAISDVVNSLPNLDSTAKNASLIYNSATGQFELQKDEDGFGVDLEAVKDAIKEAISSLQKELTVEVTNAPVKARITMDSDTAKQALKDANDIFNLDLRLSFKSASGASKVEVLSKQQILDLIYVKNGLELAVDTDALNQYVAELASIYNVPGPDARFQTTGGGYLDINVQTTGEFVDTDKLYNDIYSCLTERISGTRTVAYYTISPEDVSSNYGGNYVEINLSAQHLWIYRDGQCVVSTDIVSGCVLDGNATPTGVYTIYEKERDTYLTGPTWRNFVSYWMAFNGGIGLHDATWRYSFGDDIYLTNGSHGCVNMPQSAAAAAYNYVYEGMYVIVYGGSTSVDPQTVTGTTSYTVTNGDSSFTLDAKPKYSANLVYSSDNKKVATVDSNGKVTIVGPGTAKITVTTEENERAKLVVTVTVKPNACDQGNHKWDKGAITTAATCTNNGVRTYTCSVCGKTKTESIAATGHQWDNGKVTKEPTCTNEGALTHTCSKCGQTKTETIEAKGHVWTEWEIIQEPTCSQTGLRSRTCSQCHETETQELPTVDHVYENGKCQWCQTDDPSYESSIPEDSSEEAN